MNYKCKENIQLNTSFNYKKDEIYSDKELATEGKDGIEKYFKKVKETKKDIKTGE